MLFWILAIVALLLLVVAVKVVTGGKRIRLYEWNDRQSYIRLWPNPGWTINGRHWCRAKKARGH